MLVERFPLLSIINASAFCGQGAVLGFGRETSEQDIAPVCDVLGGMRNVSKITVIQNVARAIEEMGIEWKFVGMRKKDRIQWLDQESFKEEVPWVFSLEGGEGVGRQRCGREHTKRRNSMRREEGLGVLNPGLK